MMNDMRSPREKARSLIEESLTEGKAGDFAGARRGLDALAADHQLLEQAGLGPLTAAGEPRKLHAARLKLAKLEGDAGAIAALQYHLVPKPEVLADLAAFRPGERAAMAELNMAPVPRILHQIWLGSLALPPATAAWAAVSTAQDLTYRLWREADLAEQGFDRHPSFKAMLDRGDYPGAVDVARYLILQRFGGIYLDCDWYPARDDIGFEAFHPLIGLSALPEETPRLTGKGPLLLTNSFIAAPPGHPVFEKLLKTMPEAMARLPDAPAWWTTGPLLFTLILRATSVSLPAHGFVASSLPRRADFAVVEAARADAAANGGGLLIGWKSW